jgi:hypothetical protein
VGNHQSETAFGRSAALPVQSAAWREADAHLHGIIERVDANRLDVDLRKLATCTSGTKMPLDRQLGDVEVVHDNHVSDGQPGYERADRHQPPDPLR